MNFFQIDELTLEEYLILLRDSFINTRRENEHGREYLKNAMRLTIEETDVSAFEAAMGGGDFDG